MKYQLIYLVVFMQCMLMGVCFEVPKAEYNSVGISQSVSLALHGEGHQAEKGIDSAELILKVSIYSLSSEYRSHRYPNNILDILQQFKKPLLIHSLRGFVKP